MKVSIVDHVNHIRYKEIEVKDMDEVEELLEEGSVYDDYEEWEYGKNWGETFHQEVEEVKHDTK